MKPKQTLPYLMTDGVVFDQQGRVLLVRRKYDPCQGMYALPGGFVDLGETTRHACQREIQEETSVTVGELTLIGIFDDPNRDKARHSVSIAYMGRVDNPNVQANDDASEAGFFDVQDIELAFDHALIVKQALHLMGNS